jgi:hypothetical protein
MDRTKFCRLVKLIKVPVVVYAPVTKISAGEKDKILMTLLYGYSNGLSQTYSIIVLLLSSTPLHEVIHILTSKDMVIFL